MTGLQHESFDGHLTLISGPMFADKTNTLIDRIRSAEQDPQVGLIGILKPKIDNRYKGHEYRIISHSGQSVTAVAVEKISDWVGDYPTVSHIFIDEGHFFPDLVESVKSLIANDINVTVAGLDFTYNLESFECMQALEGLAKTHIQLRAYCDCGALAHYTKIDEKFNTGETIIVGGEEKYQPSCLPCHPLVKSGKIST